MTLAQAGTAVSIYLVAVGVGGFFGGPAADRLGPRRIIILSLLSAVPFLFIAPQLSGWLFVAALAIGGFLLQSTLPVNVTFGQTIAPIGAATVSSLMMGFAWGMGGLIVPLVGMLADRIGIEYTLMTMSAVPLVAACLAVPLPSGSHAAAARSPAGLSTIEPPRRMLPTRHQLEQTDGMRGRYPAPSGMSYSFGPGPLTPAIKAIMIANGVMFVITYFLQDLILVFGLRPADLFDKFAIWQLVTYMFLHGGISHILFNMLTLWMMGTELEHRWGTRFFTKFYFVCGIGAGLTQVLVGLIPLPTTSVFFTNVTIGASGAIFGLLLAYALYFPTRPILMFFIFPVPAKYFVMILGAIQLMLASGGGGGVAYTAHLGGIATGYLYLKGLRLNLFSEIQYRYLKWRINRTRRKFDVYSGGRRDDIDRRVH
jgi:membrane associated rhomboid family serine protease